VNAYALIRNPLVMTVMITSKEKQQDFKGSVPMPIRGGDIKVFNAPMIG